MQRRCVQGDAPLRLQYRRIVSTLRLWRLEPNRHRQCRGGALYCGPMHTPFLPPLPQCPSRLARAPRVAGDHDGPPTRLHFLRGALQDAVVAVICRDTRGFALDDAQRLTHFPASPLVCLSWNQGVDAGLVEETGEGAAWRPFGASVVLSGSQSRPTTSWAPTTGRGGMACFTPDAARALFGLALTDVHDRFLPADDCLGAGWRPLLDALTASVDDASSLDALQRHLAQPWRDVQGRRSPAAALRQAGRQWVLRLAQEARALSRTSGPRQVERRIKASSGRSLREWQSLVKTEGLFFAARDRVEAGQSLDWASLAYDEGFADQAHLSRAVKRITGFSPSEFVERFIEDESFWAYRLWV